MKPKPVTINGITYPSQRAAAEAIGVTSVAICKSEQRRIARGGGPVVRHGALVTIGGTQYPSRAAASRALGLTEGTVRGLARRNGAPAKDMRKPVEVDGVVYESQNEAARALGVTRQAINDRVLRGTARLVENAP